MRTLPVALVALCLSGCGTALQEEAKNSASEQPAPAISEHVEMRELSAAEKSVLADSFAFGLNEPDTVKFKWTKVPKTLNMSGMPYEYCAMLNIKNANGVYNGMQPFLATITTANGAITGGAIAALNSDNREEYRDVVPKLCRQKGLNPSDSECINPAADPREASRNDPC